MSPLSASVGSILIRSRCRPVFVGHFYIYLVLLVLLLLLFVGEGWKRERKREKYAYEEAHLSVPSDFILWLSKLVNLVNPRRLCVSSSLLLGLMSSMRWWCVYIDTDKRFSCSSFHSSQEVRDSLLREIGAEQQRRLDANARTRRNTHARKMMISKNIS